MTARLRRLVFWAIPLVALVLALAFALRPRAVDVDLVQVARGPLVETVAEEGETRIKDIFVLNAPIRGRALRIESKVGDAVAAHETVVAEIEPLDPEFLDLRSAAEARAAVETARAGLTLAGAELAQARAELDFATAEVERMRTLYSSHTVSIRALEDAERGYRTRGAAVETAEASVAMRKSELTAAQVRLLGPDQTRAGRGTCPCIPIHAPVDGEVLRVLHESEGVVEAGQALVEIGNPRALEIVVDFLSTDAVRIDAGDRVIIDDWGGEGALGGVVSRVEPFGFTKVSALGIDEQRVNVVIDFTDPPERWRRLGHGFRVEARVVLWEDGAALKVPLTALFRHDGGWAVFAEAGGQAALRPVVISHRTDLEAQILSGLAEGEVVVRYPNDSIAPGTRLRRR